MTSTASIRSLLSQCARGGERAQARAEVQAHECPGIPDILPGCAACATGSAAAGWYYTSISKEPSGMAIATAARMPEQPLCPAQHPHAGSARLCKRRGITAVAPTPRWVFPAGLHGDVQGCNQRLQQDNTASCESRARAQPLARQCCLTVHAASHQSAGMLRGHEYLQR